MNGSIQTLDAPDLEVRRIMQKRQDGQALNRQEGNRLASRMSVEQETNRAGGVVKQPVTPRRLTPRQMGQRAREDDDAYAGGYTGSAPSAPVIPGESGGNMAPGAAAAPAQRPAFNGEAYADGVLRRRFGAPPNERKAPAPVSSPAMPPPAAMSDESAVKPRSLGTAERLASPVAPAVGVTGTGDYIGGGGNWAARFKTRQSAQDFAGFAASQRPVPAMKFTKRIGSR